MLTLLQLHQVAEPVLLIFTIITAELLRLTANHDMVTAQLALAQQIQIEQAVSMLMQKQLTQVLALVK